MSKRVEVIVVGCFVNMFFPKVMRGLALALFLTAAAFAARTLDVYVIDVEGGKALLAVSPSGESLLIDVGYPAGPNREASTDAIIEAAKAAGLKQIDYLVISHYDGDHVGDVPRLLSRFPVRHIVDQGALNTTGKGVEARYKAYAEARDKIEHMSVQPGDRIPITGMDVSVLTAGGHLIQKPISGRKRNRGAGEPNPACAGVSQAKEIPEDREDNMSVGLLFTLGRFRMLDLADLEAHYNYELVCPSNLIGTVDVYQVNVHGQFKGIAAELVNSLHARVAIMGNGPRKGGDPESWPILRAAPGLEDIWQAHYSVAAGKQGNPPEDFIANLEPECQHTWIKLSAKPDGTFVIRNTRNSFLKAYRTHQ
jgi:competence protein ComEC